MSRALRLAPVLASHALVKVQFGPTSSHIIRPFPDVQTLSRLQLLPAGGRGRQPAGTNKRLVFRCAGRRLWLLEVLHTAWMDSK